MTLSNYGNILNNGVYKNTIGNYICPLLDKNLFFPWMITVIIAVIIITASPLFIFIFPNISIIFENNLGLNF